MMKQTVELNNKDVLGLKPITQLVQEASRFHSEISLTLKNRKVNLKSLLGVTTLMLGNKQKVTIETSGHDEKEALEHLLKKLESFS